jgi:hypothetical protein
MQVGPLRIPCHMISETAIKSRTAPISTSLSTVEMLQCPFNP